MAAVRTTPLRGVIGALGAQQGRYAWGARDCLTTASAVVAAQLGHPIDYSAWHAMSEPAAWRFARRRYGSIRLAHRAVFTAHGLDQIAKAQWREGELREGDLVVLGGIVEVGAETRDARRGHDSLGFVTPGCEVWHWRASGLAAVTSELVIHGIWRCRR